MYRCTYITYHISKYDCILVHRAYYLFTCTCVSINSFYSHSHSHHTATSTENTQNAINDNGDNLDDILRLARLQGRLEERKIRQPGTGNRAPPSPTNSMLSDLSYSEMVQHQHPPQHAGYKKPRYHNDMRQNRRQPTSR